MIELLKEYEMEFDKIFSSRQDLIKADCEDEQRWKDITTGSTTLKTTVAEAITMANDCLRGIARRQTDKTKAKDSHA